VDVRATLGTLRHGSRDPAFRAEADGVVWWATTTPDGPGTLRLVGRPRSGQVDATAWGAGSGWLLAHVPSLLGDGDDPAGFEPRHPAVAEAWRRHPGWRVPRTGRVFEATAAAVIEQKVTGRESSRGWRALVSWFGEPAPGPTPPGMRVPPPPGRWRQIQTWEFHRAGVTPHRARTLVTVASAAVALERCAEAPLPQARRLLQALPGVGPWTAAEVAQRALGDPDAVSFGDFHLAKDLCYLLTGERGDDDRLRELLAPWRGHRYRVQRLMELSGGHAPRRGPRFAPPAHRPR
jgi:3-methyladenine DNA glycosylase/8-oxoguanine DNA glycosylase